MPMSLMAFPLPASAQALTCLSPGIRAYVPIRLYRHTQVESTTYYTVSFVDGLTGQTIETQSVAECANAVLPAAPEHEGHTFIRWDDEWCLHHR